MAEPPRSLLDTDTSVSPQDWWLVFGRGGRWWHRALKAGFGHVYAIRWDGWNWIRVNPTLAFTDIEVLPYDETVRVHDLVEPDARVVYVTALRRIDRYRAPWIVGPVTCVEVLKGILGIRSFFVWTPWRLYRYLERNNGP